MRSIQSLAALFEIILGPASSEMDILEEAPLAIFGSAFHNLFGDGFLSLAQTDETKRASLNGDIVIFANQLRVDYRVKPGSKNEEDRCLRRSISKRPFEIEAHGRYILGAELFFDKHGQRLAHAVGTEAAHDEQFGELWQLFPLARHSSILRPLKFKPLLKAFGLLIHIRWQRCKRDGFCDLLEGADGLPRADVEPILEIFTQIQISHARAANQELKHFGIELAALGEDTEAQLRAKNELVSLK
mmetsp:Transcript_92475/g.135169  ORF Transcript_92475/g.135169 Transcript_92475/m.135169 type:complete len:244 (-) Transcript_92475:3052-3783(-)